MSFKPLTLLLAGLVLGQLLTACGKSPTATSPKSGLLTAPLTAAPGIAAAGVTNPQQILAAVRQASQAQQGFTATINTWERGPDGSKASETVDAWWKAPGTLKIKIVKGDATSQGVTALWTGGDQIQVMPSYLFFAVGLPITDSRLISKNGWTIKDTGISGMLNVLLDASAQLTALGPQTIDGKSVFLLGVVSPKSPKGVSHEQIGIDMQQNLPVVRLMYKADTLTYKLVASTFQLGVPAANNLTI